MFLPESATLYTPKILAVRSMILKFLIVGPSADFFFFSFSGSLGINLTYSVVILIGTQNQTTFQFYSSVRSRYGAWSFQVITAADERASGGLASPASSSSV